MILALALILSFTLGWAYDDLPTGIVTALCVAIVWLVWHAANQPDDEPDGY